MLIKTSEAVGPVLNWMVKTAMGFTFDGKTWSNGAGKFYRHDDSPSTDWSQGGPIIEREKIATQFWVSEGAWEALIKGGFFASYGPTPLIAALRCYVASKLGAEVEVPDEIA